MRKFALFILIFVFLSNNMTIFATNFNNIVKDRSLPTHLGAYVSGKIPVVEGFQNTRLQKEINSAIDSIVSSRTSSKNLKSLEFSYDYKTSKDICSIIIYSKVTDIAAKTHIDTLNFNSSRILSISDVLGENGIQIANKIIAEKMRKEPQVFYPDFNGISSMQSFYVEGGIVKICFGESEIAAITKGIITIDIDKDSISEIVIRNNDYSVKDDYQLKMIPLREVCEGLGFYVSWSYPDNSINIFKKDSLISIQLGRNSYIKGKNFPKSLESAPELINNLTHVPISFFEVFLDVVYSVDNDDNIIFSYYSGLS